MLKIARDRPMSYLISSGQSGGASQCQNPVEWVHTAYVTIYKYINMQLLILTKVSSILPFLKTILV